MSGFRTTSGVEFTPSDGFFEGLDVERRDYPSGGGSYGGIAYIYLESLWRYFENPQAAVIEEKVSRIQPGELHNPTAEGLKLWGTSRGERKHFYLLDRDLPDYRELYDYLDGEPPYSIWERRPAAVALAMLAVGNDQSEVDAIWADGSQRELWVERAKAALRLVEKRFW